MSQLRLLQILDRLLVQLGLKQGLTPPDPHLLRMLYLEAAIQYHISARYAAFAGFVPVCGVLFHHAVEMYLKGYLCVSLDERQLRRLGHRLKKVWKRFKKELSDGALNRFDGVISNLDRHERTRYPEPIAGEGMTASIEFAPATTRSVRGPNAGPVPAYSLSVDELDELSKVILDKSGVKPLFLTTGLNDDANYFLQRDNKWW